jgi:hypothetical protein
MYVERRIRGMQAGIQRDTIVVNLGYEGLMESVDRDTTGYTAMEIMARGVWPEI